MNLVGIGMVLVGIAALVAAITYAVERTRWTKARTWWEAPKAGGDAVVVALRDDEEDDAERLADDPVARARRERSIAYGDAYRATMERWDQRELRRTYNPENPLDGQVFD